MANGNPIRAQRYTLKITSDWGQAGEFVLTVNPQGGENEGRISSAGSEGNRKLIKPALRVLAEHWGRRSPRNAGFAFYKNGVEITNIWTTPDDGRLVRGDVEPGIADGIGAKADVMVLALHEDDEDLTGGIQAKANEKRPGTKKADTPKSDIKRARTKASGTKKMDAKKARTKASDTKKMDTKAADAKAPGTKKTGTKRSSTKKKVEKKRGRVGDG